MNRQQAIATLDTIFRSYRFVGEWQGERPDPTAFVDALPDLTPATFLDTLFDQYARQFGAERWGDKTPVYTSYMDLIAQIFPTAQFIHIIRDGRDVALSMVDKWGHKEFHIDLYFAAQSWKRRLRKAFASAVKLGPARYYELRYEQLTADPEPLLREICHFLGEDYLPALAEPQHLGRERIRPGGFHAAVRQPPTTKQSGRWQREMSPADQRIFQAVAGDTLEQLDYETANLGKMSLSESARFAGLHAKYTMLQAGRRILQTIGVLYPN